MSTRLALALALSLFLSCPLALAQDSPPPEGEAPKPAADAPPEGENPQPAPDAPPPEKPAEEGPAEEPAKQSPPEKRRGPTDPAELEAFLDGIFNLQIKVKHIAGATIAVVVDNKPFFSKGYGYADVAAKKKVDPAATMFRIGSVTKLFTWTAVMQLVEEGKLDLDADVNTYLDDFKIPATFPQPITLRHLLAHTPGFEDHSLGLFAKSADGLEPLGSILARQIPARVRPPGELASYSNHGTALAGYIVAQVSGMPWEDYVEKKILEPLGMTHTMVRQPPEDKMPADMSKGYKFERGRYQAEGFEYVPIAPAGSMSASADDMARFIIAHLQDGRYDSAQILQEKTARQMRELLFTHDESLEGMAYGFMRMSYNGETIAAHGGDTFLFHSLLVLLPERETGLFVSYNTDTATTVREPLVEAFLDRYFPAAKSPAEESRKEKPESAKTSSLARLEGNYGGVRHSYTSITKLGALFNVIKISSDDGELVVGGLAGTPQRFVEVEPLLFREVDGQDKLAFRQDEHGNITHLFVGSAPYMAFERLAWHQTPMFVLALVGGCAAVFLSAVVGWPWAAFIAWGVPREQTAFSRMASWFGWLMSLAALVWMGTTLFVLRDPNELAFGTTREVQSLLWASPVIAGLVALVALGALAAWIRGYWRFSARLHYTLVLAAGIAFVWFLREWNLLWLP